MGEDALEDTAITLRWIVRATPAGGVEQLLLGGMQRLQIVEVLARALIDRRIKLQVDLAPALFIGVLDISI